jgi:hypothetical protein
VAEVKRSVLVLDETEMKSLDTLRTRATLVLVLAELQTGTSEAYLLHEDTLVADGNLKREGLSSCIKTRWSGLGKLDDLGPGDVVSLDVARVIGVPTATILLIKVGQSGICRDSAVKDNRACVLGFGARTVIGRSGRSH